MRFYYFLVFFEKLLDIHTIMGIPKILEKAKKSSKNRRIFDGFLAIFSIFGTSTIQCESRKVIKKNHKK